MVMGGACLVTPTLVQPKGDTAPFRKSAEIVRHEKLSLAKDRRAVREMAKDLMYSAFVKNSKNDACEAASEALGISDDTAARIIDGSTERVDLMALIYAAGFYRIRYGKRHPLELHLLKLMGAA